MSDIRKLRTVYIISSMAFDKCYIGSTCKKLSDRLDCHKHNHIKTCSAWEVMKHGFYVIIPLLTVPKCTRSEIELKEKEYLTQYKNILVNKRTVLRTKEEKKIQNLNGQVKHKEKHPDYGKIKHDCVCGEKYTIYHKSRHEKTKKHLEYLNKK